jgi:hypothetical protein
MIHSHHPSSGGDARDDFYGFSQFRNYCVLCAVVRGADDRRRQWRCDPTSISLTAWRASSLSVMAGQFNHYSIELLKRYSL